MQRPDTATHHAELRIHLLGSFRVTIDGQSIDEAAWRRRKAQHLLAVLALAPGHRLHREQVMELLWPDFAPAAARNNLRQTLYHLRAAVQPFLLPTTPVVQVEAEWLALYPSGPLVVDIAAFEQAAAVARQSDDPAAYESALALYRGELLPENRYDDWASARREELQALARTLRGELARLYAAQDRLDLALGLWQQVVAAEPLDEAAQRELMRLYVQRGQRHQALQQYRRLLEVLRQELDTEPEPATEQLYQAILAGRVQLEARGSPPVLDHGPAVRPHHNLPHQLTSFIGREREIAAVRCLLASPEGQRLVTLTGPGGSGKTRLALQVAAHFAEERDGAWLVELAAVQDPALVPQAVASALAVREEAGRPLVETLTAALQARELLLVLDNCEHVIEACATLASTLLRTCPRLRILATSRQPLALSGEAVWPVPPLALPEPRQTPATEPALVAALAPVEAIRLFVERARLVAPAFALTPANAAMVAEICVRLDGLPLAIELAAARVSLLAVEQIAARLGDRFRLLVRHQRNTTARHHTLRAVVDWSYDLLSPPERVLFARLAVFAGDCTLEAAEAVCTIAEDLELDVFEGVQSLVDKSLLQRIESPAGDPDARPRFRMLETIRDYAVERLAARGDRETLRRQHAAYYLALAEEAEPQLWGSQQRLWLQRVEAEQDNLRAALTWAVAGGDAEMGLRLVGALAYFWALRLQQEGARWIEAALNVFRRPAPLAGDSSTVAWAKALSRAGFLAFWEGDYALAALHVEESLALYRALDDPWGAGFSLMVMGHIAEARGDNAEAAAHFAESLAHFRKTGDKAWTAWLLYDLAGVTRWQGSLTDVAALGTESVALFREAGNAYGLTSALLRAGTVAMLQGDRAAASVFHGESLAVARSMGDRWLLAQVASRVGRAVLASGGIAQAQELFEESLLVYRELGVQSGISLLLWDLGRVAVAQGNAAQALAYFEESLAQARGSKHETTLALIATGLVELDQGADGRAMARFREGLGLCLAAGFKLGMLWCLEGLAGVAWLRGQGRRAARLLGAADHPRTGRSIWFFYDQPQAQAVAGARAHLTESACAAAWAEGQAMTLEQAIAYALGTDAEA